MVERYLGESQARSIFMAGANMVLDELSGRTRNGLQKTAFPWKELGLFLGKIWNGGVEVAKGGLDVVKSIPSTVGWTAAAGGVSGVLGATAYDVVKDLVSREDPETKYNAKIEELYNNKKRELEDAKWMSRVIAMRDELKRDSKKMSQEEYESKYKGLMAALDERMA